MPQPFGTLVSAAAATFLALFDAGLVTFALPLLVAEFAAEPQLADMFAPGAFAVTSGTILIAGRAGDLWGSRRVFLLGLAAYAAGAIGCSLSPMPEVFLAARWLQAVGAAGFLAAGPALVAAEVPPIRRGRALGYLASAGALGLLAAIFLGNALPAEFTVNMLFRGLAAGALAVAGLAWRLLPERGLPSPRQPWFDAQGALLAALSIPALLWAVYFGGRYGWRQLETLALGFGGVFGLLWLLRVERETARPMIDFSLFENGRFAGALLAGTVGYLMLLSVGVLLPIYLGALKAVEPAAALPFLAMIPAAMALLSPLSGTLGDRFGTRGTCIFGLALMALGMLWFAEANAATPLLQIGLQIALVASGGALFQAANNSAILGSIPASHLGTAAAFLGLSRHVGMVLGAAIASSLFRLRFQAESGHGLPDFTLGSRSEADAFAAAMQLALHVAAALGAPAVLASLMKNRGNTQEPPTLF
jgi:MFS family permease